MNKNKKIQILINNKIIKCQKGQTILEIAQENGIEIPSLCYHPDLEIKSNCRICLIEIKEKKGLFTACSTKAENEMEVTTDSPKIERARKINLELIFSQHCEECNDCIWKFNCQLLKLAQKYQVKITRFTDRKKGYPVYQFGSSFVFDSSKCIDCRNCVEVCHKQGIDFLEAKEKGHLFQIIPSNAETRQYLVSTTKIEQCLVSTLSKKKDCIYCGQCITHCPVGAFEGVGEFEEVENPFQEKDKIIVFQFSPAVRASIAEELNLSSKKVTTKRLVEGIKKLGANKIFDISDGVDSFILAEADELISKLLRCPSESFHSELSKLDFVPILKRLSIKNKFLLDKKNLPMFSSFCPSMVKFVEFYYPEFIPNLSLTKSPHLILGKLVKILCTEKEKIDPKKIIVVSVLPCVAAKYEIQKEFEKNKTKSVDYVLTTRELAYLFAKRKIDLEKIDSQKPSDEHQDKIIYESKNGLAELILNVFSSKLRKIIYKKLTKKNLEKIKIEESEGMRKMTVEINGQLIKAITFNGMKKGREILEDLKKNPGLYDYVEGLACPGGCIAGGGQPVPMNSKIIKERMKIISNA